LEQAADSLLPFLALRMRLACQDDLDRVPGRNGGQPVDIGK
jgi:hypothetical protein